MLLDVRRRARRGCPLLTIAGSPLAVAIAALLVAGHASAVTRVRCRTAFDADYFYVAADADKAVLRGSVTAPFGDPYQDDAIGIFLASEAPGEEDRRIEMAVSVAQGAQLYRGARRTPLTGIEDFRVGPDGARALFKYRLRTRGELNGAPDERSGFSVEVGIPWIELGGPPRTGERMRFNVALFSPAEGEAGGVSFAPAVASRADAADPRKWGEIVFADAPVASIAGAPGAVVCARVFNVKPVVDGAIADGEWSRVTAFAFESGSPTRTVGAGTVAAARSRAPVELHKAPALGRIVERPSPHSVAAYERQPWPRLVFARYRMDYQCDPRKPLPLRAVAAAAGQTLIATHPMDGTGPWFTYDRTDWHRIQMTRMREAGVDVAAVMFRPAREGRLGATALSAALQALERSAADHPLVCMWLDVQSLGSSGDLTASVYDAIRAFHQCVPERFRLRIALDRANGPGSASVAILAGIPPSGAGLRLDDLRSRFAREFASGLLLLSAGASVPGDAGTVPSADEAGLAEARDGAVRITSIYAGAPGLKTGEHPLSRRTAMTYRSAWRQVVAQPPDWVFIHTWNDHAAGTEVTPTVEYGVEYLDITRAFSLSFKTPRPLSGQMLYCNAPAQAAAGTTYSVRLTVRNRGSDAWLPEDVAISAAWRSGGAAPLTRLSAPVSSGQTASVSMRLAAPRQSGLQELNLQLVRLDRRGVARPPSPETAAPLGVVTVLVRDAQDVPAAAAVVSSSLPRALEAQSTYPVTVTLRNDGAEAWPKGRTRVRARLFEQAPEMAEPHDADMADAATALTEDVPPGSEVTVTVPITAAHADGTPFRFADALSGRYLLRWDVDVSDSQTITLPTELQEVEIVDADLGAQFFNDYTPSRLPGDRRVPVPIGVRNVGPQTWLKDQVAVGYHWYYQDGIEAVWQDEVFPLKADVPPGTEIGDVGAWITAPPNDGAYWLVWDLRVGDTWGSTLPTARAYETRVSLVEVVEGRLRFVDLRSAATIRGAASYGDLGDANFDGAGSALAAELTPPYTTSAPVSATLWLPETRTGSERSRRMSFRWLPTAGANAVQCKGQQLTVSGQPRTAPVARYVHLLAVATKPERTMGLTLHFDNDSEQYTSFPISSWAGPPAHGEMVAHAMPYSRKVGGDEPGPGVSVFWYTITVKEPRPLLSVTLSDSPDVRILAISVER